MVPGRFNLPLKFTREHYDGGRRMGFREGAWAFLFTAIFVGILVIGRLGIYSSSDAWVAVAIVLAPAFFVGFLVKILFQRLHEERFRPDVDKYPSRQDAFNAKRTNEKLRANSNIPKVKR